MRKIFYVSGYQEKEESEQMKKAALIWSVFLFLIFTNPAITQDLQKENDKTGTLKLLIVGFQNDNGNAKIALCNSKEDYKKIDNTFRSAISAIKNGKSEEIFADLPFGTYAVKIYHDENDNGKLDKNGFGMPKEKYGFSNNARATFGPPTYEKAQFNFDKTETVINITIE